MRIITLNYRKIIGLTADKHWDKLVFDASYMEFKIQAQNFSINTPYTGYSELLNNIPNAARLPGLVSPAITGYIKQLGGMFPDILNNVGKRFVKFSRFQLEIINSDISDKTKHQVAVNFFSDPLIWHETLGEYLLVAAQQAAVNCEQLTNLFQLQPYLSIHTLQNAS